MKSVLICGIDGYLGYSLAVHLSQQGRHTIHGIDNLSRRRRVDEVGGQSVIPIKPYSQRFLGLKNLGTITQMDTDSGQLWRMLGELEPDAIVHLAEQPSAPYSMRSCTAAKETQNGNVLGTLNLLWGMKEMCPSAQLVKIGTMGSYGTPGCPIPEGVFPYGSRWVEDEHSDLYGDGKHDIEGMMFPRKAGSFYHLSKVHDTYNVKFACDNWGLSSTDIMQGVVYGTRIDGMDDNHRTRFDVDECFGTAINRFCAQAVAGLPITPYGKGEQKRGFLPLRDVMQCLQIAIDNPPEQGEYRTWNQFDKVYSINDLAAAVQSAAQAMHIDAKIERIENPRKEAESHEYDVATDKLRKLGYVPSGDLAGELQLMLQDILPHKERIPVRAITPKTRW